MDEWPKIVNIIVERSKRENSKKLKVASIFSAGIIFIVFIPYFVFFTSRFILFRVILPEPANLIVGVVLIFFGLPFAEWSVYVQYKIGNGTPWPHISTQKLIITGPYKYTRNPMFFGAMLFYFGLGFLLNSVTFFIILVPIVIIPLAIYYKIIEERELEKRFGDEYVQYKKKTPFLLPKIF